MENKLRISGIAIIVCNGDRDIYEGCYDVETHEEKIYIDAKRPPCAQ